MMINKRLIGIVPESRKYIAGNVALQWLSLAANITMMTSITTLLSALYNHTETDKLLPVTVVAMLAALPVRFGCAIGASKMSYLSSKEVKKTLRRLIYEKLLRLGSSYQEQTGTSEVVQVAVEGVDQLETYFGAYLPQFFYAMLAPLTLFIYLCFINVPSAVVLLILVLTPFGVNVNGATRWLKLLLVVGPTYQPSEIAKLGIVLVFAAGMSKRKNQPPRLRRKDPIWKNQLRSFLYWSDLGELLPYVGILIVIALLMLKEPHMSGTILVLAAAAAILFTAGIRWGWFALGGGLMGVIMALIVFVGGYNSDRIKTWLNPWWDPGDKGYQIVQSLYAVASGGLTGLGFGQSRQKYLYLPEEQNDFIFAIICEELGFIGAALIIILFALLIIRGYWLALHARDRFGSLLIVGITTLLAVQVFLNMAVVLNVIPATGIALPFFSYGGTALLIQLAEIGIILSVSRQIPAPKKG